MGKNPSIAELLDKKRDYSPLLVHLTKDDDKSGIPAKDVLDAILSDRTLKAANHFCYFSKNLNESNDDSLKDKFMVVCFTETPIDQIDLLLKEVIEERNFKPKPYGLVFNKKYIRQQAGNPVFYTTKEIAKPLWSLYWPLCDKEEKQPGEVCKLLALMTLYEEKNDWHWEREWRIVGNLVFKLSDIYCGLCSEDDISYFEEKYPLTFISPYWGINKILEKLVNLAKEKTFTASDIPF